MKYNFYEVLGVEKDASIEKITEALYNKLETLQDNKDIRLWNYLLRTASELQIQIDRNRLDSKQEVSEEFWKVLGVKADINKEELTVLLSEKYKDPLVASDIRMWNFLHREAQKLGVNADDMEIILKDIPSKGTK